VYAKFKCYCDPTTAKKTKAIEETTAAIEAAEAQLEDLRAQNTKLSQEVAQLESDMAANKAARAEATALRDKEKAEFEQTKEDLETGIDQLERAYNLLAAIGADQTVSGDTDSAQLMAGGASEAAGYPGDKGLFLTKNSNVQKRAVKELDEDMKAALRAASVFLSGKQRAKLHSFLQAPFTGNYNAQSGEIVGVIKNMQDTFKSNLESAITAEEKAQKESSRKAIAKANEDARRIAEHDRKVVAQMKQVVETKPAEHTDGSFQALGGLGSMAELAIPSMGQNLEDSNWRVREAAASSGLSAHASSHPARASARSARRASRSRRNASSRAAACRRCFRRTSWQPAASSG